MKPDELRKRLAKIDALESHLDDIPNSPVITFASGFNLNSWIALKADIFPVQEQKLL